MNKISCKQAVLLVLLLVVIGGHTLVAQSIDSLKNIKVTITFATPPTDFTVAKAPLRFNKTFAFSFQIDDGKKDIYSPGFQFLNGGTYADSTYPGLKFTDGCGNDIKFKMSSALFSFAKPGGVYTDGHDPNGPYATTNVTWPELIEMYQSGWGVVNHGFSSDIGDSLWYDIARNHSYVKLKMQQACPGGPDMRMFANPNGVIGYTQVAFDLGYLACFRQGSSFGRPSLNVVSTWQHHDIEMYRANLYGAIDLSALVDAMAVASINGAHHWGVVLTHYITNGQYGYTFPVFKNHMNYIANTYGKNGLDNVWMATEEEILEYLLLNDLLDVQTLCNENVLEITFTGNIPADYRFYQTSLLVGANAIITSITTEGVGSASFVGIGTSDAMINLSWNGREIVPAQVPANTWVTVAENSQSQLDANIALDYIAMVPDGPAKDSLRERMCNIPGIELPEGFCNIVPVNATIQDEIVPDGETTCYDARNTITVAGDGTFFIVQGGGNATMVAGENIRYLPGTLVEQDGYLHGYIAVDSQYCSAKSPSFVAAVAGRGEGLPEHNPSFFRVSPNPNNGHFILEVLGNKEMAEVNIDIFNMHGVKLGSEVLQGEKYQKFSLEQEPSGIYFIHVISGNTTEIKKIIKL